MNTKAQAEITYAKLDIHVALDKIASVLKSKDAILSNATRLAVLQEQLQLARKRLADANYDLAQTKGYGLADNFTPNDIVKLDNDIGHLERMVTSAKFAVKHEK